MKFDYDETSTSSKGTSNSSQKTQIASKEKINLEAVGITKSGDFVIKVTNNNNCLAVVSNVIVNFMDENGTFCCYSKK